MSEQFGHGNEAFPTQDFAHELSELRSAIEDFEGLDGYPHGSDQEWLHAKSQVLSAQKDGVDTSEHEQRLEDAIENKISALIDKFEGPRGYPHSTNQEWIDILSALLFAQEQGVDTTALQQRIKEVIEGKVEFLVTEFESSNENISMAREKWVDLQSAILFAEDQGVNATLIRQRVQTAKVNKGL